MLTTVQAPEKAEEIARSLPDEEQKRERVILQEKKELSEKRSVKIDYGSGSVREDKINEN